MLIRDIDIQALVTSPAPVVTGIKDPHSLTCDSPVQPASLDLKIGNIYLPGAKENERGSVTYPTTDHSLAPGKTAVVETHEELAFPDFLAGIAFPPDSVSKDGLLMTNPGHIDPGYSGRLKFTVINMGQAEYPLRAGAKIATVLMFRLAQPCQVDYSARCGGPTTRVTGGMLSRLAGDFMQVDVRATRIAKEEVRRTNWQTAVISLGISLMVALLLFVAAILPSFLSAVNEVRQLDTRISVLEAGLGRANRHGSQLVTPSPRPSVSSAASG